jgi:hypothetical protein
MPDERAEQDFESVFGKLSWVLWRQFDASRADRIKAAIIMIGIATGVLALIAATTAVMVTLANWPIGLLLLIVGVGMLIFAWFVGLHRFDGLLFPEA